MNFLFAQSLLETLMPGARNGAIKILPIQSAVKLILSHHGIIVALIPENIQKLFGVLIGKRLLEIFLLTELLIL